MRRGYMAFAWDLPNRQRGHRRRTRSTVTRTPGEKMAVRDGGREAITHWELQEAFNGRDGKPVAALLACQLEDRPHPSDPGASGPISAIP